MARPIRVRAIWVLGMASAAVLAGSAAAADPAELLSQAKAPPPIRADEPLRPRWDAGLARQSLDESALHWQKSRGCVSCHTTAAYMMARPALPGAEEAHRAVRGALEDMVQRRWVDKKPGPAYIVATACSLAINDRRATGELHPATRAALDRMWEVQRPDGGFDWLHCGWAPMEIDDHYGATFAVIGVGSAPGGYAETPMAKEGLAGIRRYLENEPAPTVHHRAMLLWASLCIDGVLDESRQAAVLEEVLALQLSDGGWSLSAMLAGWPEFRRLDDQPQRTDVADAYATGFSVWLALQAGVAVEDERIQKGVRWLEANQRESGRWYTPSPTKDGKHYITNTGAAWAVLALHAAGAVPKDLADAPPRARPD